MKKITGFFLALLPIFVIFLMFVSGMIVKQYTHVFVSSVEFARDSIEIKKENDDKVYTSQLNAIILPFNASNPVINYYSSDESVATVDQNGLVTVVDFGEANIYAISQENQTITDECHVEVWDDKIHRIDVKNEGEARYLGVNQSVLLEAVPVPSTRLSEDPTLYFDVDPRYSDYVNISSDGEIQAKDKYTTDQPVEIEISTAEKKIPSRKFELQIGPGVTSIDLVDPSSETISDDSYNFFEQIQLYPESEASGRVLADDFTYTTDNADVATIDEKGKIQFLQPGTAEFTARYIKNNDLFVSKTITSTCSYLLDVAFNRYNFEGSLGLLHDQDIPTEDVNWHLYPESQQENDEFITISSSDESIVSVVNNKLHVNNKAGYATITAEYKVPNEDITKKDQCVIHIYDQNQGTSFVKQEAVTTDDTTPLCYPLRENIRLDQLINENQNVTYTCNDTSIAEVDQSKELLNFKKGGTVEITATTEGKTPQTFTVTSNDQGAYQVIYDPAGTINLEVGNRYVFYSDTLLATGYLWANWDYEYYHNNFFHGTEAEERYWFIPKAGGVFEEAVIYYEGALGGAEIYSTVKLIIHQEPIANMIRANEGTPYYSTFKQEVVVPDVISVYPRSATKTDGTKYLPSYTFTPEDPNQVVIEDNNIVYRKSINVDVTANFGNVKKDYTIRSTVNNIGKFALDDPDSGSTIQSGASFDLIAGGSKILDLSTTYTHDIPELETLVDKFDIDSTSGNCTGSISYSDNKIHFLIQAKENANGKDVIKISTGTFVFYLNINIEPNINDFNLYFEGTKLKEGLSETNLSYTTKLILDIEALPIKAKRDYHKTYNVTLNGTDITSYISSDKIDFNNPSISALLQENNSIIITADEGSCSRQFNLVLQEQPTTVDFKIKEANNQNDVYLQCGATRSALTILVDGFVDDDFYGNFTFNYVAIDDEEAKFDENIKNKIVIKNITKPTASNPGFNNRIKISLSIGSTTTTKEFNIERDTISKITFPGHDNQDIMDQKGLQKVHVYGTQSYYNKEEGLIDYYKLPINIYDYNGKLIEDPEDKEDAFDSLDCSITTINGHTNSRYMYKDGYVYIDFDEQSAYRPKEIYENKFETGIRDVLFKASTHSEYAKAQYKFVPVVGINAYCKEAITNDKTIVLQTNFGLEGATKDNVVFDDPERHVLWGIYGNGYTINFDAAAKAITEDDETNVGFVMNTTIQGCNDSYIRDTMLSIQTNNKYDVDKYFAYNTFKNLAQGLFVYCDSHPTYVKNCLFFNNSRVSINVNADGDENMGNLYLEDSVMFNCSSAAIDQVKSANIFFKGFVDVYNFKNRDVLKNILGYDFSPLWDIVRPQLAEQNAMQIGADGREYVNSYMIQAQQGKTYFWDGTKYVEGDQGLPTACNYLKHFLDVNIEYIIPGAKAGLWGTPNLTVAPEAPSYYDEFDTRGNIRWDFLSNQVRKIMRPTTPSWLI